jgi:inner membrane protein YidH
MVASQDRGARVDPRLLQANERTLLAWIRTGLALAAFGIVIERVEVWLHAVCLPHASPSPRRAQAIWLGAAFVVLGNVANGMAILRYLRSRRMILQGEAIGSDQFPVIFGIPLATLEAAIAAILLLQNL